MTNSFNALTDLLHRETEAARECRVIAEGLRETLCSDCGRNPAQGGRYRGDMCISCMNDSLGERENECEEPDDREMGHTA